MGGGGAMNNASGCDHALVAKKPRSHGLLLGHWDYILRWEGLGATVKNLVRFLFS